MMKNERLKIPKKVRTCFGIDCSMSENCLRCRLASPKHRPGRSGRLCEPGSFYPEYIPDNFPKDADPDKDIPYLSDRCYELVEVGLRKIQDDVLSGDGSWIGKDLIVGDDGRVRVPAGIDFCSADECSDRDTCLYHRLYKDIGCSRLEHDSGSISSCSGRGHYRPDHFPAALNLFLIGYWSDEAYAENEQNILYLYDN